MKQFKLKNNDEENVITYESASENGCYEINPITPIKVDNMIDIEKIVIISPDLIHNLINRKVKKNLEKILKLLAIIYDDDSEDDGILNLSLNEIERMRERIAEKYQKYMSIEEHKLILKKLEILESEIKLRKQALDDFYKSVNKEKPKEKKAAEIKQKEIVDVEKQSKSR